MFDRIETLLLAGLRGDLTYAQKFLPHLQPSLFGDRIERALYMAIGEHVNEYQQLPDDSQVMVTARTLSPEGYEDVGRYLIELSKHKPTVDRWFDDQTCAWIKGRLISDGLFEQFEALNEGDKGKARFERGKQQVEKGQSFTLDAKLPGMTLAWEPLHEILQRKDQLFPFESGTLNHMTYGGVTRKTLNVIVAPTGTGKTLVMCDLTAQYLRQKHNVLYITLEMAEHKILKRVYANLLDTDVNTFDAWDADRWEKETDKLGPLGKLHVREFGSRSASAATIRSYIKELKRRDNFTPDIIIVDYLNECAPIFRSKNGSLYESVGEIAANLRAMALDLDVVVWTATQTNRNGYGEDPDLENTSESAQTNSISDLMIGIVQDADHDQFFKCKITKVRDKRHNAAFFMLGVDKPKMKLWDLADPFAITQPPAPTTLNAQRQNISKRKSGKPAFA